MAGKNIWTRDLMNSCGLVVLFPDATANIWDSELNGIVNEIEERLDGAVVSLALLNGRQPSLMDAIVATRFLGCTQAVVAVVGGGDERTIEAVDSEFPVTLAACAHNAESVIDAYYSALLSEPAACA
jgi:hypothetical protein